MRNSFWVLLAFSLAACDQGPEGATEARNDSAAPEEIPALDIVPSDSYEQAYAAAVAAIEVATTKRHTWTTSDQLLKDAASAAADGDETQAIMLADEARWHAQLAVFQADREALSWRDRVISD